MRSGTVIFTLAPLLAFFAQCLPLYAQDESTQPRFKIDVYAGVLEVRVTDAAGRPVTNLQEQDFQVVESGSIRPILAFSREESVPLTLAILIDTGSAMSMDYVSKARDMVLELIHLLDPEDEILLGEYGRKDVFFLAGPTSDRLTLTEGLWNIATSRARKSFLRDLFKGSDSLTGPAIDFALIRLKPSKYELKVVLVISAGFASLGEATLDHLQMAGARLFAITLPNRAADVLGLGGDQMARKKIVEKTGGISFSPQEVVGKMETVRGALKNRYLMAFEPHDAGLPRLEVRVPEHPGYGVHFVLRVTSADSPF